jgi:hypothetical protein
MQVKPDSGSRAYASATISGVISRAQDTHLPNRVVRLGDEWDELAEAAGKHKRAAVIRQLVRWYLRYPGAKLPERPPRPSPRRD